MSAMTDYHTRLMAILRDALDPSALDWLTDSLQWLRNSQDLENDLLSRSAMARRKLGSEPLGPLEEIFTTEAGSLDCSHWSRSDAGRVCLLMAVIKQNPENATAWIDRLFRAGDERERAAVVKGLSLFPSPGSLKHLALEAGRCNSLMIYSALALRNPYITRWYDEHEYNQVVLKSLFTGLDIDLIAGLEQKANREPSRMCEQYADERLAANRTVPADISLAIGPHASDHGNALMLQFLQDPDARHRYYSALALGRRARHDPELFQALRLQLSGEENVTVRAAIEQQLAQAQE